MNICCEIVYEETITHKRLSGKGRRPVERIEDVLTTDAPYEDTLRIFRKRAEISGRSESKTDWEECMFLAADEPMRKAVSLEPPPFRHRANHRTIYTRQPRALMCISRRPRDVGLGYEDYDLSRGWQSHGRQVTNKMVANKEWRKPEGNHSNLSTSVLTRR